MPKRPVLRSVTELITERVRLATLFRSRVWRESDRRAIASALDTIDWALGRPAVLSPYELFRIQEQPK